jgi:hypothetical protein
VPITVVLVELLLRVEVFTADLAIEFVGVGHGYLPGWRRGGLHHVAWDQRLAAETMPLPPQARPPLAGVPVSQHLGTPEPTKAGSEKLLSGN